MAHPVETLQRNYFYKFSIPEFLTFQQKSIKRFYDQILESSSHVTTCLAQASNLAGLSFRDFYLFDVTLSILFIGLKPFWPILTWNLG